MTIAEKIARAKSDYDEVYEAGKAAGFGADYNEGYAVGYDDGRANGIEDGKQAAYDAFWGSYCKSSAKDCDYMFAGQNWNARTFTPPAVTLAPTRAMYMFSRTAIVGDTVELFGKYGFSVDFSQCTYIDNMFNNANGITRLGTLDFSGAKSSANNVFINATRLKTIDKLIVGENTKAYTNWFNGASALESLTVEGVIDKNGFSVQLSSELTHDSLMSIVNALKDYSTDTSGTTYTVTLGGTNFAKLTDDEISIARSKGWKVV